MRGLKGLILLLLFCLSAIQASYGQSALKPETDHIVGYLHLDDVHQQASELAEILTGMGFRLSAFNLKALLGGLVSDSALEMVPRKKPLTVVLLHNKKNKKKPFSILFVLSGVLDKTYMKASADLAHKNVLILRGHQFIGSKDDLRHAEDIMDELVHLHDTVQAGDISIYLDRQFWDGRTDQFVKWISEPAFGSLTKAMQLTPASTTVLTSGAPLALQRASIAQTAIGEILKQTNSISIQAGNRKGGNWLVINIDPITGSDLSKILKQRPAAENALVRLLPERANLRMAAHLESKESYDFLKNIIKQSCKQGNWPIDICDEFTSRIQDILKIKPTIAIAWHNAMLRGIDPDWMGVVQPVRKSRSTRDIHSYLSRKQPASQSQNAHSALSPSGPAGPPTHSAQIRIGLSLDNVKKEKTVYDGFEIYHYFDPQIPPDNKGRRPADEAMLVSCLAGNNLVLANTDANMVAVMDQVLWLQEPRPLLIAQDKYLSGAQCYIDFRLPSESGRPWSHSPVVSMVLRAEEGLGQFAMFIPSNAHGAMGQMTRYIFPKH